MSLDMGDARLDLTDIQGNILRGYAMPFARYVFLTIRDAELGRAFLGALADRVTNAEIWDDGKPECTLNVALSRSALRALDLPAETIVSFPVEFLEGMAARWDVLGDDGPSHPDHWEPMWRERVDLWASINALSAEAREAGYAALAELAAAHGVAVVGTQAAAALVVAGRPVRTEHFGYSDGFGQPDFVGGEAKNVPGDGKIGRRGGWDEMATGEFVLGHRSEADELSGSLDPALLARNGSFLVYRKLEQDVAAFRAYVREWGARYPGGPEKLMAKFVGRWRDGTPLTLSPDRPDPAISGDRNRINDFTYADDADGLRCPVGAHIRRVNPRDGQGFEGRMATRRRIVRRGLPFGEAVPEGEEPDGGERGIVFMAIGASIALQFEFVQQQWVNYGNDFRLGETRDPVIGNNHGGGFFAIPGRPGSGEPPFFCTGLPSFVTLRGGDYFFLPSLSALRLIAAGAIDPR
jgi:Dyp-type peroxidase family